MRNHYLTKNNVLTFLERRETRPLLLPRDVVAIRTSLVVARTLTVSVASGLLSVLRGSLLGAIEEALVSPASALNVLPAGTRMLRVLLGAPHVVMRRMS